MPGIQKKTLHAVTFKTPKVPGSRVTYMNPQDNVTVDFDLRLVEIPGNDGKIYAHGFESVFAFVFNPEEKTETGKK